MSDISVVVCTYSQNRWAELFAAVQSVRGQSCPPDEVIVVVDRNHDLLQQVQSQLSDVIAVENSGERGLSSARNAGIAVATGAIIAFLDDDAVADPDWLAALTAPYSDPAVIGVGGSIEPLWIHGRPRWFPEEFDWVVGCTYRGMPATPAPVRNLIGCNMSFRREVFATAGLFRTDIGRLGDIPMGCEETHFCIALAHHLPHGRLLYEPAAQVRHRVPAERSCWRYFRSRCYAEGRSKALVSRLLGTNDSLSSERSYTVRTLPRGVLTGLSDAVTRHDVGGLARSAAIAGGLAITTAGYVHGRLGDGVRRQAVPPTQTIAVGDRPL